MLRIQTALPERYIEAPDDLAKWILDPPSLKPNTAMPKLGLSPDEAAAAAAYLYSIQ